MTDPTLQSASPLRIYEADISWLPPMSEMTMTSKAKEARRCKLGIAANLMADGRVTHVLMVRAETIQEQSHRLQQRYQVFLNIRALHRPQMLHTA